MSGSKCPEMIGYVGDVRILAEGGYVEVNIQKIETWVQRSKSVEFATLFYSQKDIWGVSKMYAKLLKINPKLQIKKISDIQEFINYVDTGMDRNEHPVKEIEMINVQSTWEKESIETYIEGVHQAEQKTVIKIFLDNESIEAEMAKHQMSVSETIDKVKKHYHYDEAKTIGDEIIGTAGKVKGNIDHSKDRVTKIFSKGLDGYDVPAPTTLRMTGGNYIDQKGFLHKESLGDMVKQNMTAKNMGKTVGRIIKGYGYYGEYEKIDNLGKAADTFNKSRHNTDQEYKDCINASNDWNSPTFGEGDRCIQIRNKDAMKNIIKFISKGSGHPEMERHLKKVGGVN